MSGATYNGVLVSPRTKSENRARCAEIDVLAPRQRELCSRSRHILDVVSSGASAGIDECQYQFRLRRWNCSTFNTTDVFGKILDLKTREKAYIYAVSSAGVMHAVTQACARGTLDICSCDTHVRAREPEAGFLWGGCSHNVNFGGVFTREFVDSNENRRRSDGLMNLWNNAAGRKTIKETMRLLCKCHGVSGSCSIKICWRTMAKFRDVGAALKEKFNGASRVRLGRKHRFQPLDRLQKRPTRKDLVYLEESPDFCEANPAHGSLGTHGRQCNRTSYGLDGCRLMCCGRGYHTIIRDLSEDCNCKFFWCCRVVCETCTRIVEQHFCN
ncbi:hypothetical protein NP493_475g00032 [Ridgeia piscesae]|uniref:Protein Wnt n=1 Tax=Ridgeia piscesae TaxID=27915 RepID=A0AAD9KY53_RIDPI|nr:hypothetical protein NP493_475g00032 [Ridgeia piscesae]